MIESSQVIKLAQLARLKLNELEIGQMQGHLAKMMEHVDALKKVPTEGTQPLFGPVRDCPQFFEHLQWVRQDDVAASRAVRDVLSNAPDRAHGQFKLEAVIQND